MVFLTSENETFFGPPRMLWSNSHVLLSISASSSRVVFFFFPLLCFRCGISSLLLLSKKKDAGFTSTGG